MSLLAAQLNGIAVNQVSSMDRGLHYGDGLFETILVENFEIKHWPYHAERMIEGCKRLLLPVPDFEQWLSECHLMIQQHEKAVLKLIYTRGEGGRGYQLPAEQNPTRITLLYTHPEYPLEYSTDGITVRFCELKLSSQPHLAGIKHLNRLEYILARNEWSDPAIQEGLLLDQNDYLREGVSSNLFFIKDQVLCTPAVEEVGVAGTQRKRIFEIADLLNMQLVTGNFVKNDLISADEAFVSNAVIGIWPIKNIINTASYEYSSESWTKNIQSRLDA